ncbi:CRISPR-associated endonuclease Cas2 [Archangium minus]|uniref:CRISPR-associated endoribonuclease Cas2 n=1 Tax=Archangium minus TaxID=83450 RepID=A0ABY9X178_9BACT|nr:CRISPR-associated endonuclease Cas2 [Archangium minus]
MFVIVCYDVSNQDSVGARRLRRIAEACKNYGVRVQYSVFECQLEAKDWVVLRDKLLSEYDSQRDSLRFYYVSIDDAQRIEHYGVRRPLDPTGPLVV